jgi:hypothetical protein
VSAAELVAASGVEPAPERVAQADEYLSRRRRTRWIGLVCGIVAGVGPLAGDDGGSLFVPRLLAGYLFGVLLSELLAPRQQRGTVRAASLKPREAALLVPRWALALPWALLLPLLATPFLAIGWHPTGVTQFHGANGECFATAYWPSNSSLFAIGGVAAGALVLLTLAFRRLTRRPQPAEDAAALQLDLALRARSARASIAAASALGLTMTAVVGQYVYRGIHSYVCTRPLSTFNGNNGNVYSWAGSVAPWVQNVSLTLFILAIPTWMLCQRLPRPSSRSSAS